MDKSVERLASMSWDMAEDMRKRLFEEEVKEVKHYHEALYDESGKLTDKCAKCERDIRNSVHFVD